MRAPLYRPFDGMSEALDDSASLQGAVHQIAKAWRCPFEALSTEQDGEFWHVLGPEGQYCGYVEVSL